MNPPSSATPDLNAPKRAASESALYDFGRRPESWTQESAAAYPAFATLLAAHTTGGGQNDGYRYSLRDSRIASEEREIIPIDKHTGIAGRDRANVIHELNRLRNSKVSAKRRRLAALTGATSIVVAGATGYMVVCDIISLIRQASIAPSANQDRLRTGLLIANLSIRSISFVGICIVILWCRYARRPSTLARPLLLLALLAFVLQILLSLFNILLVLIWRTSSVSTRNVADRCEWGLDILWQLGDSSRQCVTQAGSGDTIPWVVAASIRLLIVLIVGSAWFHLVRKFNHTLRISSIIDPDAKPDGYIASLLEKNSANIVNLDDTTIVRRSAYTPQSGLEYLPPMPERRRLLRTDEEDEIAKLARPQDTSVLGRLRSTVGWLFGTSAYEGVKERPDSIYKRTSLEKDGTPRNYTEEGWTLPTSRPTTLLAKEDEEPPVSSSWNPLLALGDWLWGSSDKRAEQSSTAFGTAEQSSPMLCRAEKESASFDPDAYAFHSPFANNPLHPDYAPPDKGYSRPPSFASRASPSSPPPAQQPEYKALFSGLGGRRTRTESGDSFASGKLGSYDPAPSMYIPLSPAARGSPLEANLAGVGIVSAFTEHIDTSPPRPPPKTGMYSLASSSQADLHASLPGGQSGHTRLGSAELALRDDYVEYEGNSLVIEDAELDDAARQGQLSAHHRRPSGSVVYIRMSDGRLVRKLSTIVSERESTSRETSLTSLSFSASGRGLASSRLPGGW